MRRKHEEKVFQSLSIRNMDNLKHAYFFAIDISWFNKWRSFIYNDDKTSKYLDNYKKYISDNKKIGILPPGIIDNSKICIPNKEKKKGCPSYILKPGLILDKDYCIVNQYLWEWFLLNYRGGPEIQLSENINDAHTSIDSKTNTNSIIILGEEDLNNKKIGNMIGNINNNKNSEENKEQDYDDLKNDKNIKNKNIEKEEEIIILNKFYNSKLTDIKAPKMKNIQDKLFEPEVKQRLFKSLISDINI